MSVWNYAVTAHRPSSVSHAVTAAFTGVDDLNLILAKSSRLEVHLVDESGEGLKPILDVPLYGSVAAMEVWRPHGAGHQDYIFISTERHRFCLLAFDAATGEIVTKAAGDLSDKTGRPSEVGQVVTIDPEHRMIGLHMYDGLFKVIPALPGGSLKHEAFNVRMEELSILDVCFLYNTPKPTLATLHEDDKGNRHLRTHELVVKDKMLAPGPWSQIVLEATANKLLPLPSGGVIVLAEDSITYHDGSTYLSIPTSSSPSPTCFQAWGKVDPTSTRWLLGDQEGMLYVLALTVSDADVVTKLHLERLGVTSSASAICYLDNGVVFLGSCLGDSQLLSLSTTRNDAGTYFSELGRWDNIGPIVDFVVLDPERQGQGQVVTCSGARQDGSLRVVRSGVAFAEQARLELPGVKGMWSLRPSSPLLVLSFVSETRILATSTSSAGDAESAFGDDEAAEELGEVEIEGFDAESPTIYCATLCGGNALVQVTPSAVRLVDSSTLLLLDTWQPSNNVVITMGDAAGSSLLLATAGGGLVLLACRLDTGGRGGSLALLTERTLPNEIACIAIRSPSAPLPEASDVVCMDVEGGLEDIGTSQSEPQLAAVGQWTAVSVSLLALPSLDIVGDPAPLGTADVLPRSLAFYTARASPAGPRKTGAEGSKAPIGGTGTGGPCADEHFLLCGMGDGKLKSFALVAATSAPSDLTSPGSSVASRMAAMPVLGSSKSVPLASQPLLLVPFTADGGEELVFACCERPALVHSSAGKLLFSSVNLSSAAHLAPFATPSVPSCLAATTGDHLLLGTIVSPARRAGAGSYRRPQVTTVRLGEQPRRISHLEPHRALAVLTTTSSAEHAEAAARQEARASATSSSTAANPSMAALTAWSEPMETSRLRIFDDSSLTEITSTYLRPLEMGLSVLATCFSEDPPTSASGGGGGSGSGDANIPTGPCYIVVGTAIVRPKEPEPTEGRLLVFELTDGVLELRHEHPTKGAVYCLEMMGARLLAGVNNKLQCYEWSPAPGRLSLRSEHCGHILVLYVQARGDFILVGDLMKSMTLLQWAGGQLTELARDYNAHWMTAISFLDDDTFLGAENRMNVFVARKRAEAPTEEERGRLEVIGEYHLGEFVNRFRRGSLTMQMPEAGTAPLRTTLYGTVNGAVGVLACLPQEQFALLSKVGRHRKGNFQATVALVVLASRTPASRRGEGSC